MSPFFDHQLLGHNSYLNQPSVTKGLLFISHQWDEAWIEQQLGVFHPHCHDQQS